jgi:hypothetical protein
MEKFRLAFRAWHDTAVAAQKLSPNFDTPLLSPFVES